MLQEENNKAKQLQREFTALINPLTITGNSDSDDLKYEMSFERMIAGLRAHCNKDPKELTVVEAYSLIDLIDKKYG